MSITLGVSVYPEQESLQQIDEYLKLASSHGFTKVFTSMFSVPGTTEEVADYFRKLTGIAHQYGMFPVTAIHSFLKKWEQMKRICSRLSIWESTLSAWICVMEMKEISH